MSLIDFDNL